MGMLGAAGDQGCQEHPALLAQRVLRGIRRAKGCACWAPDSPAAAGLRAVGAKGKWMDDCFPNHRPLHPKPDRAGSQGCGRVCGFLLTGSP